MYSPKIIKNSEYSHQKIKNHTTFDNWFSKFINLKGLKNRVGLVFRIFQAVYTRLKRSLSGSPDCVDCNWLK